MKKLVGITVILLCVVLMAARGGDQGASDERGYDAALYHDLIFTALAPTIDQAIAEYYAPLYIETPGVAPFQSTILRIQRPNGDRTPVFLIEVEVFPYFGPHLTVGRDQLLIQLSYGEGPKLLEMKHLEDVPLPEHYAGLYRP